MVGEGVGLAVRATVGVKVSVSVAVAEGVRLGVQVAVAVIVWVAVRVGVSVGITRVGTTGPRGVGVTAAADVQPAKISARHSKLRRTTPTPLMVNHHWYFNGVRDL